MSVGAKINIAFLEAMKNAVLFNQKNGDLKGYKEQQQELSVVITKFEEKVNQPFGEEHESLLQEYSTIASKITLPRRSPGKTFTLENDFVRHVTRALDEVAANHIINRDANDFAKVRAQVGVEPIKKRLDEAKATPVEPKHAASTSKGEGSDVNICNADTYKKRFEAAVEQQRAASTSEEDSDDDISDAYNIQYDKNLP